MIRLTCFDVNGTILDDTTPFLNAINGIFIRFGKPALPSEVLKEKFGQPWTKIYREYGISEKMASDEELYEIYNKLYTSQPPAEPFENVKETLEWLLNKNVLLGIVTTQQSSVTIPILENYGLKDFFNYFECGISDKAQALQRIFYIAGVNTDQAAYVGDQEGDVAHAKKAGCVSIAFCGGLHTLEKLSKAKPDFLIHDHLEITKLPIF